MMFCDNERSVDELFPVCILKALSVRIFLSASDKTERLVALDEDVIAEDEKVLLSTLGENSAHTIA